MISWIRAKKKSPSNEQHTNAPGFQTFPREKPSVKVKKEGLQQVQMPGIEIRFFFMPASRKILLVRLPQITAGISHLVFCKKAHPSIFFKRLSKLDRSLHLH